MLLFLYLMLVGLAIIQAGLMVLQAWEHHRFARSRLRTLERTRQTGRAIVFAPCKGVDVDLEDNLRRLFHQDYHDYEIAFIVESESDPACPTIRRLMAENSCVASRLIIAGRADDSGQKVHNLRVATGQVGSNIEFLVFVDSDAHPRPEWLRALVTRLGDRSHPTIGAATGYRWFIPSRPTLANHLLYGINSGIATLLGSKGTYPIWGGSWAIRREQFEAIGLRQQWQGTLSDDLVAARAVRRAGRAVKFEPLAMVVSPIDGGLRQTFSFIRRQYLITRFYAPWTWAWGFGAIALPNLAWWLSVGFLLWGWATGAATAWIPAAACAAIYLVNMARTWMRQRLVTFYCPELQDHLRRSRRFDIVAWPLVNLANGLGMAASMFGRHITWRGITYQLSTGGRIRITRRDEAPSPARRRAA